MPTNPLSSSAYPALSESLKYGGEQSLLQNNLQYVPDFVQMVKCLACEIMGYNPGSLVDYWFTPGHLYIVATMCFETKLLEIIHRFDAANLTNCGKSSNSL